MKSLITKLSNMRGDLRYYRLSVKAWLARHAERKYCRRLSNDKLVCEAYKAAYALDKCIHDCSDWTAALRMTHATRCELKRRGLNPVR